MATCGPSNPLASLGKQVSRDSSLQQEGVYEGARGSAAGGRFRSQRTVADNASFNQVLNQPSLRDFAQRPDALPVYGAPQLRQAQAGPSQAQFNQFGQAQFSGPTVSTDWSAEFSRLSVRNEPVQTQFGPQHEREQWHEPSFQYSGRFQQPMPLMTNFASAPSENLERQKLEDDAFSKAFAAVEQHVQTLDEKPPVAETEDLSGAARSVIDTVSSASTDEVFTEKMKSSKFMALLGQLSTKGTVADGEGNFVDANGEKIDPYAESHHPQKLESENRMETEDTPFRPEHIRRHHPSGFEASGLQRPLEDPMVYLERMKTNNKLVSPFEEANRLGPIQVNIADWEEHYEDAVWTQP